MMLAPAAVGADRQPAADDLAQAGQVGRDAEERLGAAVGDAEAGDHLVEDEQAAGASRELAQRRQEAGRAAAPRPCCRPPARR